MTIRTILAAAALSAIAINGPAIAQSEGQTFRIAHAAAESEFHSLAWEVFAEQVEAALPGRFEFELFPNGSLYRQGDQVPAMARGNLEGGHMSNSLIASQIPAASVLTSGYLFRDPGHICAFWASDAATSLVEQVASEMGIRILAAGYLGTRHVSLREPMDVMVPADLDGVRLRMPNSQTWLFLGSALGADPNPLPFGELYLALRTGTVDGQDNPIPTLVSNNFYEVQNQVVLTGHLVDSILFAVSEELWQSLDDAEREVLSDAAGVAADYNTTERIIAEGELVSFLEEQGMTITTPDVDAFRSQVQAAYLSSDFSADWEPGIVDAINALEPTGRCAEF